MEERIRQRLCDTEKEENVRILLAVESGSRAWGFASQDSDYDVRFVYVRPRREYLRLAPARDVIEYPIEDELDINGWDVRKALLLMRNSNPTVFEWLDSPIVYRNSEFAHMMRNESLRYFSPRKSAYHYISIALNNYDKYLSGDDEPRVKKYLYAVRTVLACRWIAERKTPPPVLFEKLTDAYLPGYLRADVDELLRIKRSAETRTVKKIAAVDRYIRGSVTQLKDMPQTLEDAVCDGYPDELFFSALEGM